MSMPAVVSRASSQIEEWKHEIAMHESEIRMHEDEIEELQENIARSKAEVEAVDEREKASGCCLVCGYLNCLLPHHKEPGELQSFAEMLAEEIDDE
jgi:hypothetical protein